MSDAQETALRDILGQVTGKWSMTTLHVLYVHGGPLRFARLMEQVVGITQKMMTQTVRHLERDGLISREVFAQIPPRVEYQLTPSGAELIERFLPFWTWIMDKLPEFEAARQRYQAEH